MDIFHNILTLFPGANDAAKLRFLIVAAAGVGLLWGLARWLGREKSGATSKTALDAQAPGGRAAAEPVDVPQLLLNLSSKLEALLAAMPGEAIGLPGAKSAIVKDLTAAVHRLAGNRDETALASLAAGDYGPAMAALAKIRMASLQSEAAAEADEAALAREQGAIALFADSDDALRLYASACVLDPDNAGGWYRLGELKLHAGDPEGARRCYAQAVSLSNAAADPEAMGTALGYLGLLSKREGNRAEACALWREALDVFRANGMTAQIEELEGWMREAGCAA
ncbi:MAG: tetratricopeptide repeat protein [Rhodomicrobium sp.]